MSTDRAQEFLNKTSQGRGYTLDMHRIMAEADLEWAEKYHDFVEMTYSYDRIIRIFCKCSTSNTCDVLHQRAGKIAV